MKNKKTVILYESFFEATSDLSDYAISEIWRAIQSRFNGDEPIFTDKSAEIAWKFIRIQLESDSKKWEKTCEKRAEVGRAGGLKSGEVRSIEVNEANEANASKTKQNEANEANASKTKQNEANEAEYEYEYEYDIYNKEKINKKEILNEQAERIWQAYQNKNGKREGIKAIVKALQRGLTEQYLLERVNAYAVCVQGKEQSFIKYAQGWFNNERYLDSSLDNPQPPSLTQGANNQPLTLFEFKARYRRAHTCDCEADFPSREVLAVLNAKSIDEIRQSVPDVYEEIVRQKVF